MSNIKVIDVNTEEVKQEEAIDQPIEEPAQEPIEEVKQEVNEIVEHIPEQPKEDTKPVKAQDKLVRCPKCNKEMKLKSLRYGHQQKCQGTLEQKPVKSFSKPRATPKPKTQPIQQQIQVIEPKPTQPVQNQILTPQPSNPLADITNHYQLLQQQFIQQKKEKYNVLCQNMFTSKSKKR